MIKVKIMCCHKNHKKLEPENQILMNQTNHQHHNHDSDMDMNHKEQCNNNEHDERVEQHIENKRSKKCDNNCHH